VFSGSFFILFERLFKPEFFVDIRGLTLRGVAGIGYSFETELLFTILLFKLLLRESYLDGAVILLRDSIGDAYEFLIDRFILTEVLPIFIYLKRPSRRPLTLILIGPITLQTSSSNIL
jgi:hypothetical protein